MIDCYCILGSDAEDTTVEEVRTARADSNRSQSLLRTPQSVIEDIDNDEDYEAIADDVVEKIWRMFRDHDSWTQESVSSDGRDIVVAKNFPKIGKVFRLTVRRHENKCR